MNDVVAVAAPSARAARVRVLVVDDSAPRRAELTALLQSDREIEVVAWAADGPGAVRTAARAHPDIITLDLRMAAMDGVAITQHIMRSVRTPIVVTGSTGGAGEAGLAVDALAAGVATILTGWSAIADGPARARELCRTVKRMAGVALSSRRSALAPGAAGGEAPAPRARASTGLPIVAIGASTGGPQALSVVLAGLPASFPVPVLVVQHIALGFLPGLVDWLRPMCALPLAIAEAGQSLATTGIFLAPTGRHMHLQGQRLDLTDGPPVSSHRPSVTVLFQSVARAYAGDAIGVQLTGMGDDGAAGLATMHQAGATTIAQDEATSVVFGMPAVAIGLGCVDFVLPLLDIAPCVVRRTNQLLARRTP